MSIASSKLNDIVREVLMHCWDPIGVRGKPSSVNEYDSYVSSVSEMLGTGADRNAIGRYLHKLEHSSMGLPGSPPRCDRVASELLIAYHRLLLCPQMRDILDAELRNGNAILESSKGWLKDDSVFIRLARPITIDTPAGMDRRDVNDPHYWKAELYDHRSGHIIAW